MSIGGASFQIQLDFSAYSNALKKVQAETKLAIETMQKSFEKFSIQSVIALGVMGTGLLKGIKTSLSAFAEWENALASVQAKANASNEEFEEMKQLTLDLAGNTKFLAKEAADALLVLVEMGLEANESIAALPIIIQFATTENMKLADAADIVLGSMRGMGKGISDLEHISNLLANTAAKSASTIFSLGQGFKVAGPFAYSAGQSMEDLAAILGGLANRMIRNEAAGYAVSQMLARLTKAASTTSGVVDETGSSLSKARQALKDLGVTAIDPITKKLRALPEIFKDLKRAGVTPDQMMSVFGIYTVKTATALLYAERDVTMLRKSMEDLENVTKRMADIQLASLTNQWKMAKGEVNEFFIALGENLSEDALGWTHFLKDTTAATKDFVKENKEVTNSILQFITALGGTAIGAGALSGLFWAVKTGNPYIITATVLVAGFYTAIQQVSKYLDTEYQISVENAFSKTESALVKVGKFIWKWNPFTVASEQIIDSFTTILDSANFFADKLADIVLGPAAPEVNEANLTAWELYGSFAGAAFMQHLSRSIYRGKEPIEEFLRKYITSNRFGFDFPSEEELPTFGGGPTPAELETSRKATEDAYSRLYQGLRTMSEEHYQFELDKNEQTINAARATILENLELRKEEHLTLTKDLLQRKFIVQQYAEEEADINKKLTAILIEKNNQTSSTKFRTNLQAELLPLEAQLKLYENIGFMTAEELSLRKQILAVSIKQTKGLLEEQGVAASPEALALLRKQGVQKIEEDAARRNLEVQTNLYSELESLQSKHFKGREDAAKALYNLEIEKIELWYNSLDETLKDSALAWEVYNAKVVEAHRKMVLAGDDFNEGFKEGIQQYIDEAGTGAENGADIAISSLEAVEGTLNNIFTDFRKNDLKSWQSYLTSFTDMVMQALQQALIQMLIIKALGAGTSLLGGVGGGGAWAGLGGGTGAGAGTLVAHSGGFVTKTGIVPKFHRGGLASDELPAILQTGERVLSRRQNKMFEGFMKNSDSNEAMRNSQAATVNNITIQALDAHSFARFASQNESVFANAVMMASKKNHSIRRF